MKKKEKRKKHHSYKFLKERKDDPKWKDEYLKSKSLRTAIFIFLITLIIGLGALFILPKFINFSNISEIYDRFVNKYDEEDIKVEITKTDTTDLTRNEVYKWIEYIIEERNSNLEYDFSNDATYNISIIDSSNSFDGYVYAEVRHSSTDKNHNQILTIFRVNENGYLEELKPTGEYKVIETEYYK